MRTVWALLLILAACGSVTAPVKDDAGLDKDATMPPPDVMTPPPDATPPGPSREFTGGAGRMRSNSFTFDVQIGHVVGQQPASSSTYKLQGNAAVKP